MSTPDPPYKLPVSSFVEIMRRAAIELRDTDSLLGFITELDDVAAQWKIKRPANVTPRQVHTLDAFVAQCMEAIDAAAT